MKRIIIAICLIGLMSCNSERDKAESRYITGYKIVTIDSCEYISTHVYAGSVLTHKGNCKYCTQRKEIKP